MIVAQASEEGGKQHKKKLAERINKLFLPSPPPPHEPLTTEPSSRHISAHKGAQLRSPPAPRTLSSAGPGTGLEGEHLHGGPGGAGLRARAVRPTPGAARYLLLLRQGRGEALTCPPLPPPFLLLSPPRAGTALPLGARGLTRVGPVSHTAPSGAAA